MEDDIGFGEDGERTKTCDFDFAEVDRRLAGELAGADGEGDIAGLTANEVEAALAYFRRLVRWLWGDGLKDQDSRKVRTVLMLWMFLEELHAHRLPAVGAGFGLPPSALEASRRDFARHFPQVAQQAGDPQDDG